MTIRQDQHVDEWIELAVDYLDGRSDADTRAAIERHLAGCPECARRLDDQGQVIRLLQHSPLVDPPDDLEYRTLGELVFPSPGTAPLFVPPAPPSEPWSARLFRRVRPWVPVGVAVVALLTAVVTYGVVRSGVDELSPVAEDARTLGAATAESAAEMGGQLAAPPSTALVETESTATKAGTPDSTSAVKTAGIIDRKKMIKGLEAAQGPAYLVFLAETAVTTTGDPSAREGGGSPSPGSEAPGPQSSEQTTTYTTAPYTTAGTQTIEASTTTTAIAKPASDATVSSAETEPAQHSGGAAVTAEQATEVVAQLAQFSGLEPLEESLWLDGPTYAVYLPRIDAEELVDLLRSIGASVGLTVMLRSAPPEDASEAIARLMEVRGRFPILEASRAPQPATWGFIFTTSTLGGEPLSPGDGEEVQTTRATYPDEGGKHILLFIYIEQGRT